MPTKYGVTRNYTFEEQLRYTLSDYGEFTTKQAYEVYESTRKPSGYDDSMNARNYLAGAITAGVIKRVRRGVYTF